MFSSEILAANQFSAADASFHLDASAAQELARGILEYHAITSVEIANEAGVVLAVITAKEYTHDDALTNYQIFGGLRKFSQSLFVKGGEKVGVLTIWIDPELAAEGFIDRSILVLISGLIRNILLAFILVVVFYKVATKKIMQISTMLQNLELNDPHKNRVPIVNYGQQNELDDLGHDINEMLDIISSDIQKLESREQDLLASQDELSYQANHDVLTGLINRRGFDRHLKQAMQSCQAEHAQHTFCYIDLDQFKIINDTCGHIAGDELLRQMGKLIKQHIRTHDILARLGGDEFGILMQHCDVEHASKVAKTIISKIEDFEFFWQGQLFVVRASIGIAAVSDATKSSVDLLRNADIACYAAKNSGRNCFRVYEQGNGDIDQVQGDMAWVNRINQSLEKEGLVLYGQKISPLNHTGDNGLHYEVLLRILEDDGSVILPGVFLPAAERYHLMPKIDDWVIRTQFKYLAEHPKHLRELALCTINLSGQSLALEDFRQAVIRNLDHYKIPPEKICFEITETVAVSNLTDTADFIEFMRARGCKFSLDDFGTGLSSFAYLKNLPVDYLKIDGVFVKDIVDDPIDFAMVKSINEIGHVMGKKTVAEFVENDQVRNKLMAIGVDYAQGIGVALPCPIDDL